jgi:signal transduction histidine kinase
VKFLPLRRLLPRSLRWQFNVVLAALAVLIVAATSTAVYALRAAAETTRALTQERVARMQDGQELVQRAALIERQAAQMMAAPSLEATAQDYALILEALDGLDRVLGRLAAASTGVELLDLQRSGQLFRNTTHVVARLRTDSLAAELDLDRTLRAREEPLLASATPDGEALAGLLHRLREEKDRRAIEVLRQRFLSRAGAGRGLPRLVQEDLRVLRGQAPGRGAAPGDPFSQRARRLEREQLLGQHHRALQAQALQLISAAQALSDRFTAEYRSAASLLAERTRASANWVVGLVVGSLLLAWLIARVLRRQVLDRLQEVSAHLRRGDPAGGRPRVPVGGNDEIAEMARAVELLLVDRQRLEDANRELEAVSATISHDMRAPLRHVEAFSALLRQRSAGTLDAKAVHYLDAVSEAGRRMGSQIDALLSFIRMRRTTLVVTAVDLRALAEEVMAELSARSADRSISWTLGALPTVRGDRSLLRLAVASLVSNAVKFTAARERAEIEIGCTAPAGGEEVVLFVRDNGVGFEMAYADRLFRVFHRLQRSEDFGGLGIGLANVRRIVERHGGRTWAEGAPGKGATFFIALPALPAAASARAGTAEEARELGVSRPG